MLLINVAGADVIRWGVPSSLFCRESC